MGGGDIEKYKKDFAENEERKEYIRFNRMIKRFLFRLKRIPETLGFFYSKEPYNPDELEMLLDTFIEDKEFREEALHEVEKQKNSKNFIYKYQKDKARREAQER